MLKTLGKYFTIRGVSRIGDIIIYASILYFFGQKYIIHAFVISTYFNIQSDYLLQKYWTFEIDESRFKKYIALRIFSAIVVLSLFTVVNKYLISNQVYAIIVVAIAWWPIFFYLYTKVFSKTKRDT